MRTLRTNGISKRWAVAALVIACLGCGSSAGGGSANGQASASTLDANWYAHPAATASAIAIGSAQVKLKALNSDYVYDGSIDRLIDYTLTSLSPALLFNSFAQRGRPGKQFLVIPIKLTLTNVTYPNLANVVTTPSSQGLTLIPPFVQCTATDQLLRPAQSDTPSLDYNKEDAGFYTLLGQALHLKTDIPSIPAPQTSGTDTGALIFVADSGVTQMTLDCKLMNRSGDVQLHHIYSGQSVLHWTPTTG